MTFFHHILLHQSKCLFLLLLMFFFFFCASQRHVNGSALFSLTLSKRHTRKQVRKCGRRLFLIKSPFSRKERRKNKEPISTIKTVFLSWRREVPVMVMLLGQQQAVMLRVHTATGQKQQLAGVHIVLRKGPLILETVSGKITQLLQLLYWRHRQALKWKKKNGSESSQLHISQLHF